MSFLVARLTAARHSSVTLPAPSAVQFFFSFFSSSKSYHSLTWPSPALFMYRPGRNTRARVLNQNGLSVTSGPYPASHNHQSRIIGHNHPPGRRPFLSQKTWHHPELPLRSRSRNQRECHRVSLWRKIKTLIRQLTRG